ncbi:MAG: DUF416 family protein [Microcoleaceae cyanobacterium]
MNLNFYDFEYLETELEKLPPLHRIAFAASGCERLLPNYNAFSREENWGDPSILTKTLDEIWQIIGGKPLNVATIEQLKFDTTSNDIVPHSEDFAGYCGIAQEACSTIYYTLDACINPTTNTIIKVAEYLAAGIELFQDWNIDMDAPEYIEIIARHPFAIREMEKQNEDLQRLKETETLEAELLEWLRTTSHNNGKSLIDLSD